MSYKLEYPYTEQELLSFYDLYNSQKRCVIIQVDNFVEETITEEVEEEREITEEREIIETREITEEQEITEEIPIYDEITGEITGTETVTRTEQVVVGYEEVFVGTETVVIGTETVIVEVEVGTELVNYPTHYALEPNEIWDEETQQPIIDEQYEEKQKAKEKERISELSLTRADVFEGLILARGLTKQALRAYIELDETLNDIEKALYLNRFDDALEFYRKHPAIDFISAKLGISSENMDKFFDTKDYNYLKPVIEVK